MINLTLTNKQGEQVFPAPIRFDIIDIQTKKVVGSAKTRAKATQSADRRDQAYGAVRFIVKAIYQ